MWLGGFRRRGAEGGEGVERALRRLLDDAASRGASDVHLEPVAGGVWVRYRVDGELRDGLALGGEEWPRVAGLLRYLSGLDLLDGLHPQDGVLALDGRTWRVALLPCVQGERVTLRLQGGLPYGGLGCLGLEGEVVTELRCLLEGTGLLAITGPASSGKTTTLYACLKEIADAGKSAISVEDPVEQPIPGVTQVQIRPRAGFGFLAAVRAALRHDPRVLAIGEVRDEESARAAVRCALGGHLVLCTLHAGSAGHAVERLVEMGVDRRQLAGAVCGILEQRLVRKPCPRCQGLGCPRCAERGWQGRRPLARLVPGLPGRQEMLVDERGREPGHDEG